MLLISAKFLSRSRFPFHCFVLVLVGFSLPRAALPSRLSFACVLAAWGLLVLAALATERRIQRLYQLGAATALALVAALDPPVWLASSACLVTFAVITTAHSIRRRYCLVLGIGVLCPAALYGGLFGWGEDQRTAIRLAFRLRGSLFELVAMAFVLALLASITDAFLTEARSPELDVDSTRRAAALTRLLTLLVLAVLALRLAFIASVATLRTDLIVWSEPPALVNLLKLRNAERFYGPMEWANSYSYSPGMELTQYAILRPFHLELSLRAHRALGLLWQLASAVVLSLALLPWLGSPLRGKLGGLAFPALVAAMASITLSSLLAPHVHPDHLLLLCFCGAIALCLRREPFLRRDSAALVLLPIAAMVFKLTGAGVGLGLALAVLFERRWRALAVLAGSGVLSLLTIPLFNATLGSFSAYAIHLQASHSIEWWRIGAVPHTVQGSIVGVALLIFAVSAWLRPGHGSVRAASRVLLVTIAFGLTSLVAFLKHGGRENSLMPFAIGGMAALLVLLGDLPGSPSVGVGGHVPLSALPLVVLFWGALCSSWPAAPILGERRRLLIATHEREVSFLSQHFAQGARPWSQGTSAWIDAGRRDTPRDRLSSASELELGHLPALFACEARLVHGEYDALFLSASALADNDFLRRLRPQLQRIYRVSEPQTLCEGDWACGRDGYVILEHR